MDIDTQGLLRKKFLKGPKFDMPQGKVGINYWSGNEETAFYEVWGKENIFKLVVLKPANNLYVNNYVGQNTLLILLSEGSNFTGGFIDLSGETKNELRKYFSHLEDAALEELAALWSQFVKKHYFSLEEK